MIERIIEKQKGRDLPTKENSAFNKLPINYNYHTNLQHLLWIYETELTLQEEVEDYKEDRPYNSRLIKNEAYYDARVRFDLLKVKK